MRFNQKLIKQLAAGEIVLHINVAHIQATRGIITEIGNDPRCFLRYMPFYYREKSGMLIGCDMRDELPSRPIIPISDFLLPENGTITESQTFCGSENQFEIGKCYEFSDDNEEWGKGKLLAIVDHRGKYVAGFEDMVFGFEFARPIQPKEIERWINMSQSGNQVGKKCFESEMEACQHAPQSQNVFQVKLTGTYTI